MTTNTDLLLDFMHSLHIAAFVLHVLQLNTVGLIYCRQSLLHTRKNTLVCTLHISSLFATTSTTSDLLEFMLLQFLHTTIIRYLFMIHQNYLFNVQIQAHSDSVSSY